jgi:chorismate synthase
LARRNEPGHRSGLDDAGDAVGGAPFEVVAQNVPPGPAKTGVGPRSTPGSAQALAAIQALMVVGRRWRPGRHCAWLALTTRSPTVRRTCTGISRPTNNAGGLEGGVTNGEDLRVSAWMKPISTLMKPLRSVDLGTMTEAAAAIERSDVCAVTAAAVVGEAMVALMLADAVTEKFGGDSIAELRRSLEAWTHTVERQFHRP